jgi:Lrp/AsnC family leucine-responsive transcriptional regulator
MSQGRMTWAELATLLGLSAPAAAERVRQLEAKGVIRQYTALLNAEALGYPLVAFVSVVLEHPQHRTAFLDLIRTLPEVQECHHVAGEDDYLLKVRCRSTKHLEWLLNERLKALDGVSRTRTTIALNTVKETGAVPLPGQSSYEE